MFDSIQMNWTAPFALMAQHLEEIPEQVSDRCYQLRMALGYPTATAFAVAMEINYTTWHMAESTGSVSKPVAWQLQRKIGGFRAEWLWLGDRSMMPAYLLAKLDTVPPRPDKGMTRSA